MTQSYCLLRRSERTVSKMQMWQMGNNTHLPRFNWAHAKSEKRKQIAHKNYKAPDSLEQCRKGSGCHTNPGSVSSCRLKKSTHKILACRRKKRRIIWKI